MTHQPKARHGKQSYPRYDRAGRSETAPPLAPPPESESRSCSYCSGFHWSHRRDARFSASHRSLIEPSALSSRRLTTQTTMAHNVTTPPMMNNIGFTPRFVARTSRSARGDWVSRPCTRGSTTRLGPRGQRRQRRLPTNPRAGVRSQATQTRGGPRFARR
jgi:hypothetical protein